MCVGAARRGAGVRGRLRRRGARGGPCPHAGWGGPARDAGGRSAVGGRDLRGEDYVTGWDLRWHAGGEVRLWAGGGRGSAGRRIVSGRRPVGPDACAAWTLRREAGAGAEGGECEDGRPPLRFGGVCDGGLLWWRVAIGGRGEGRDHVVVPAPLRALGDASRGSLARNDI